MSQLNLSLSEDLQASIEQSTEFGDTLGAMAVSCVDDKTKSSMSGAVGVSYVEDKTRSLNPG